MPEYFARTLHGLEEIAHAELRSLGYRITLIDRRHIEMTGPALGPVARDRGGDRVACVMAH